MTEAKIRALALEKIRKEKGVPWFPKKVKWHETDAWGVFDILIIYPPSNFVPIQITSRSNMSARKKKILNFFNKFKISIYCEVWGWDKKIKEFKIQHIYEREKQKTRQ